MAYRINGNPDDVEWPSMLLHAVCNAEGFIVHAVVQLVQHLTRFQLTKRVARSLCDT